MTLAPSSSLFLRAVHLDLPAEQIGQYPFALPIFRGFQELHLSSRVTILVGENGSGKSTLLEAIATSWGLNPEGGSRNFHFATKESHSNLHEHMTLVKGIKRPGDAYFLRSESYYNLASEIERLDESGGGRKITPNYGGKSLHHQSHGESFLSLFLHRFHGNGLYILDEPEAALSPPKQLTLLARISDLVAENAQFIIATHSPILLLCPEADLLEVRGSQLVKTAYRDTQHFQTTRDVLNNPEAVLRNLL